MARPLRNNATGTLHHLMNQGVDRNDVFFGDIDRLTFERLLGEMADEQLAATVAYVHRNPIDLVPVAALGAYRWSSYGVYLGRRPAPSWLDTSLVSELLPIEEHRRLVIEGLDGVESSGADAIVDAVASFVAPTSSVGRAVTLVAAAAAGGTTADLMRWFRFPSPGAARTALSRARNVCGRSEDAALIIGQVGAIVGFADT